MRYPAADMKIGELFGYGVFQSPPELLVAAFAVRVDAELFAHEMDMRTVCGLTFEVRRLVDDD